MFYCRSEECLSARRVRLVARSTAERIRRWPRATDLWSDSGSSQQRQWRNRPTSRDGLRTTGSLSRTPASASGARTCTVTPPIQADRYACDTQSRGQRSRVPSPRRYRPTGTPASHTEPRSELTCTADRPTGTPATHTHTQHSRGQWVGGHSPLLPHDPLLAKSYPGICGQLRHISYLAVPVAFGSLRRVFLFSCLIFFLNLVRTVEWVA